MDEGNPVLNIQIGGNGASTARLYIYWTAKETHIFIFGTVFKLGFKY